VTTVWILGDQLASAHPALAGLSRPDTRVLMVESKARGSLERYHQVKLVLVYSAMRHYAQELRAQGWQVDYHGLEEEHSFASALAAHTGQHRPSRLLLSEPNSFAETRAVEQLAARAGVPLSLLPSPAFLLPREEFREWAAGQPRLLMEPRFAR